jgi:hypothetical protein
MRRFVVAALVVAFAGLTGTARAEDKANPTGTWKWSTGSGNRARETTLKLKLEGDKLTGAIVGRDGKETAVEDPTYKDGTVSFTITRERNGQKSTTKYSGKVSGDTIKGKRESDRGGKTQSGDWEAKRVKDKE